MRKLHFSIINFNIIYNISQTINLLYQQHRNLKELYLSTSCCLDWALNKTRIEYNYEITFISCNEKSQ